VAYIPLKVAIVQSGLKLGEIADRADIRPWRFSKLLHSRAIFTADEKRRIARVLHRRITEVFPDHEAVSA